MNYPLGSLQGFQCFRPNDPMRIGNHADYQFATSGKEIYPGIPLSKRFVLFTLFWARREAENNISGKYSEIGMLSVKEGPGANDL
jgi:hypothetical protein